MGVPSLSLLLFQCDLDKLVVGPSCLALAACTGPPPVRGHCGKSIDTWLILLLLKTTRSIQYPLEMPR